MKKLIKCITVLLLLSSASINAQLIKVVNHFEAPVWAPGAPETVRYYYLPDIQTYYDVPSRCYIYFENGGWIRRTALPTRYRAYNLRSGHTVFLTDYHGSAPYEFYKVHKVKFRPNYSWKKYRHDNGHHRGNYKKHRD